MKPGRCKKMEKALARRRCHSHEENSADASAKLSDRVGVSRRGKRSQRLGVRSTRNTAFGENRGNVAIRSNIERGMRGMNVGSDANSLDLSDFGGRALFDGNLFARGNGEIERRDGRGNIKRYVVFARQHGNLISADLIRGIAVRSDAIRSGNNRSNISSFQEVSDHVVCNQRQRNVAAMKFPG